MRLRAVSFVFLALLGLPAVSAAGPVPFEISVSNLQTFDVGTYSYAGALGQVLQIPMPVGGSILGEDTSSTPVSLSVVNYTTANLARPAPIDIHNGGTHWNFDGYFSVDVTVIDETTHMSQTVTMGGRAHIYNNYDAFTDSWSGEAHIWFMDYRQFTIGSNLYTLRGENWYTMGDPATLSVWVGPNAPVNTPEPATFALFALGLAPIGLRRLRGSVCS